MTYPDSSALPVDPETDRTWRPLEPAVIGAVFVGGAVGGAARAAFQDAFPLTLGELPWTTLTINVTGALALALLLVWLRQRPRFRLLRPLLGTGFLGGWTTFSAVVVVADRQIVNGHAVLAGGYVLATAVGGLLSALAGFALGRRLLPC